MIALKTFDDENVVFTVTVTDDGQLVLSVPGKAIDEAEDFSDWVGDNAEDIDQVVRVAINHERAVKKEQMKA